MSACHGDDALVPYDGPWVLSRLVADRAERLGHRVAVSTSEGDATYADLADGASRFAAALRAVGVAPGDRVATMLPSGLPYANAWMGTCWAGAVDVPINNDDRGTFLEHKLRDSGATALVVADRWVERLQQIDAPALRTVFVVGDAGAAAAAPAHVEVVPFAEALASDPAPLVDRDPDDLVYVIFTSGTTGPSKGVMHTGRNTRWYVEPFLRQLEWRAGDVAYSMFPLFHQMGRTSMTTTAMWVGRPVVLRSGFSVSGFWDDVRSVGATIFGYLGTVIHLLYQQPRRDDDADNPLRIGFGAAAPADIVDDFERRFGVTLLENYGSTELGLASMSLRHEIKRGTMGRTVPWFTVEIHDDDDRPVPAGVRGEIVVRPNEPGCMMSGYWNHPEATLQAYRNLWFHTGDAGHLTDDGYLVFSDRVKDSIRRRGENISSFEVERAVSAHPQVLECAAYSVASQVGEDEVMVSVIAKPGEAIDLEDLMRFCIRTMPRFTVPRYLRLVDELPKTPSQRVQKHLLRAEGVTADAFDREAAGLVVPKG